MKKNNFHIGLYACRTHSSNHNSCSTRNYSVCEFSRIFIVRSGFSENQGCIKVIEKGLGLHRTKGNPLPLPDEAIIVTASGTTIFYQGYAGTGVLETLKQAGYKEVK